MTLKTRIEMLEKVKAKSEPEIIAIHLQGSDRWVVDGKQVSEAEYRILTKNMEKIVVDEMENDY